MSPTCPLWGFALAAVLATSTSSAAQPLDLFDLGAPSFTTFTARDGVPEDVGAGIQVGRDGFVWMSTAKGLARYDGHRWNGVDPPAIPGVLGSFLLDHEGTLWVAFRDGGIARLQGGQWRREDLATGLPTNRVRRVAETRDADGNYRLWLTTFDVGLWWRDGTR
jgi:ligand-binding sensor domain-containing protein